MFWYQFQYRYKNLRAIQSDSSVVRRRQEILPILPTAGNPFRQVGDDGKTEK
jgi:hypothetical protein